MAEVTTAGVRSPEVSQRMTELGYLPMGGGPGEMADLLHRDLATMEQLVRVTGASAD